MSFQPHELLEYCLNKSNVIITFAKDFYRGKCVIAPLLDKYEYILFPIGFLFVLIVGFIFLFKERKISSKKDSSDLQLKSQSSKNSDKTSIQDSNINIPKISIPETPIKDKNNSSHKVPSSPVAVNTQFDVDDFVIRLYKTSYEIFRHKPAANQKVLRKPRCMKLSKDGDLCIYKRYKKGPIPIPYGSPYMKIPLSELLDSFSCEGEAESTFIVEFKSRNLRLSAALSLDTNYLMNGFKNLATKIQKDPRYLLNIRKKLADIPTSHSRQSLDDDNNSVISVSTITTATTYRK